MDELVRYSKEYTLFDLHWFPQSSSVAIEYDPMNDTKYRLQMPDGTNLALESCNVVWWGRPRFFGVHPDVQYLRNHDFAIRESCEAIRGLWHCLDAFWVNNLHHAEIASRKSYQLRIAQQVGLRIPKTLITNDPAKAREFIESQGVGSTVYKIFRATPNAWRETRLVGPEELDIIESIRYAPVILQEYIQAKCDLRVTIVGDEIFAAAFYPQGRTCGVDIRMEIEAAHVESTHLPDQVEIELHTLMDRLGIVYGAIDMRLTSEGECIFLEVNPHGLWRYVEERTGQPITASLASLLAAHDN